MNSISQHMSRKRYNKASTKVIYYINDKMSDTNMWKRRTSMKLSLKLGATGTSTVRRQPRSPHTLGNSGWTPPRRRELSSSRVSPKRTRGKRVDEASVSTQLVLNKYNTNYEALRLAVSTALAFNLGKILLNLITTSWRNYHNPVG